MKFAILSIVAIIFLTGSVSSLKCYSCQGDEKCNLIECSIPYVNNYCYTLNKNGKYKLNNYMFIKILINIYIFSCRSWNHKQRMYSNGQNLFGTQWKRMPNLWSWQVQWKRQDRCERLILRSYSSFNETFCLNL